MLGKIKLYVTIALGFAVTILFALWKTEKAGRAKDKVDGMITAQKKTEAATKATMEGLKNEQEAIAKANTTNDKRNDFE